MPHHQTSKTDRPRMLEISRIVSEAKGQTSFFFNEKIDSTPGQFIMVWLPGVDEKPMAVSYHTEKEFAFTSHAVGDFTRALEGLKAGDTLGIRGPYGRPFSIKKNSCVVAGGIGISSVSTLIDVLDNPLIIYGARDNEHLMYLKRYHNKNMMLTTDDGSLGRKGFTTDLLSEVLEKNKKIKMVYACGPEIMMKKILDLCIKYDVPCEMSVERFMKCGFGVCGNCMVNDKIVCMDGPIFSGDELARLSDFGNYARKKTGKKVSLGEYYQMRYNLNEKKKA